MAIFVIIIYIPYTCLRVCYKHMLCLMYDFFLPIQERYIPILIANLECLVSETRKFLSTLH